MRRSLIAIIGCSALVGCAAQFAAPILLYVAIIPVVEDRYDPLIAPLILVGLALVPLRLYFREGRAKVELGLAKGRQKGDKRQAIAERDSKREMERALGRQRKGMD